MKTVRLAALVMLAVVSACGGSGSAGTAAPREHGFSERTCADVVIVAVRGQGQSPKANHGAGTELRLLATELMQRAQADRDVSVRLESLDYESNPPPDLGAYDRAVAEGADLLDRRLDRLEKGCPKSELAVLGFSQGAQVVHEALHDRARGGIGVVAMLADPERDPVAPYRQFTFGKAAPNPGSIGAGPSFQALVDRTVSFCAPADDVCNHSQGASRTAVDQVHKHFYEKPAHVNAMAAELLPILQRNDS